MRGVGQLLLNSKPLGNADADASQGEKGYGHRGSSGPIGRAALCIALLIAGAFGMKKGLYKLLDYPPPHSSAPYVVLLIAAASAIVTGSVLALTGFK